MTAATNSTPPKKHALRLADMLPPGHILWRINCQSKKRVFEQVSILLENISGLSRDEIFSRLIARERLGSTAIGEGGAVPHVRVGDLQKPLCALARLAEPIQYNTQQDEGGGVHTLFFLIAPEKANAAHLSLLAVFSQMLMDADFMRELGECATAEEAHCRIGDWETARAASLDDILSAEE